MARKKVAPENSLAAKYPELIKDWDYELNKYGPEEFDCMSKAIVHWKCHKDPEHRWMASIVMMATGTVKCPGCNPGFNIAVPKRKPKSGISLAESCPEIADEWYQPYNGTVTPKDVAASNTVDRYWFKCSKHGVIWPAFCHNRTSGRGCPVCKSEKSSATQMIPEPGNSLADLYPELTSEWNILLNDRTPDKVYAHSNYMAHWICSEGHKWVAPVSSRTCNGAGCSICGIKTSAEKRRIPKPGNSLLERFPIIASEFVCTEYGVTDPSMVAYSSNSICTWHCSICGEVTWKAGANTRTSKGEDLPGCSTCAQKRASSKPRKGIYLKDGAPNIAAEWDEKRNREELGLELSSIALHSNKYAYWICPRCNESYFMQVNHRTARGSGCTNCDYSVKSSFPEKAILYYIQQAFPDAAGNASPSIEGLGRKEFDIWIPSIKSAVEYDGFFWHESEERDIQKEHVCFINGIRLIRVRESRCPVYMNVLSTIPIIRNSNGGFKSLDEAIVSVLTELRCEQMPDVNTMRDEGAIRRAMRLEFIKGSLAEQYPDVAAQWDYDNNGDLTPWMFKPHSDKVVSWICLNGNEPYTQAIKYRTSNRTICSCKTCKRNRKLSMKRPEPESGKSLKDLFPKIAAEWMYAIDWPETSSADVGAHSNINVHWRCSSCEHEWDALVKDRTHSGDRPCCKECRTKQRRLNKLVQ